MSRKHPNEFRIPRRSSRTDYPRVTPTSGKGAAERATASATGRKVSSQDAAVAEATRAVIPIDLQLAEVEATIERLIDIHERLAAIRDELAVETARLGRMSEEL